MDDKLKKVLELSKQLQAAVNECGDVIGVTIDRPGPVKSTVHVYDISKLDGVVFDRQDDDYRWFHTDAYGIRIVGAVRGGDVL